MLGETFERRLLDALIKQQARYDASCYCSKNSKSSVNNVIMAKNQQAK